MQERALKAGVDIIVATPGPADRSHAAAERRPQRHRAAGARRSRPHDGHGLLARRAPHHRGDAGASGRRCSSRRRCRTMWCGSRWRSCASRSTCRSASAASRPRSITHRAELLPASDKLDWLIEHLRRPDGPVLIFSRTKIGAERLAQQAGRRRHQVRRAARRSDARSSGASRSKDSAAASTRCWSPPTSPRAASTSTASTP